MRSLIEVMVRQNSQPSFFVNITWVSVNLREVFSYSQMLQKCLNEKHVGITHNPQITPEQKKKQMPP